MSEWGLGGMVWRDEAERGRGIYHIGGLDRKVLRV